MPLVLPSQVGRPITLAEMEANLQLLMNRVGTAVLAATSDMHFYVSKTGNDANDGLTEQTAFLTIQKGIEAVARVYHGPYLPTLYIGAGTYTEAVSLRQIQSTRAGVQAILTGPTGDNSSVVITHATQNTLAAYTVRGWMIDNLKLTNTAPFASYRSSLVASQQALIDIGNIQFGASNFAHIYTDGHSTVRANSNYSITGSAYRHISAHAEGTYSAYSRTITLTGAPAFSGAFCYGENASLIQLVTPTFIGSATGKRYELNYNTNLRTDTGNTNLLPGNAAGTAANTSYYS